MMLNAWSVTVRFQGQISSLSLVKCIHLQVVPHPACVLVCLDAIFKAIFKAADLRSVFLGSFLKLNLKQQANAPEHFSSMRQGLTDFSCTFK